MHIFNLGLTKIEWGKKIAPNLINIGVDAYLSNGYLNPLSILNYEKVDKSACFQAGFTSLKWGLDRSKSHKNRFPCLSLKRVPKSTFKTQSRENRRKCIFSTLVWPPLTCAKITPNLIKIGLHAYLSIGYLNPLSKLNSEKVNKSTYLQRWFHQPWRRAKIAQNIIKIGVHGYLSNGYLNLL